jgi:hypothetical protein
MTVLNGFASILCHISASTRQALHEIVVVDCYARLTLGVVASQNSNTIRLTLCLPSSFTNASTLTTANMTVPSPHGTIVASKKMSSRASSKTISKLLSAHEIQER